MTQAHFEIRLTAEAAYQEIRCIRENESEMETCVLCLRWHCVSVCVCVLSRAFVFHAFESSVYIIGGPARWPVSVHLLCSANDQINWREKNRSHKARSGLNIFRSLDAFCHFFYCWLYEYKIADAWNSLLSLFILSFGPPDWLIEYVVRKTNFFCSVFCENFRYYFGRSQVGNPNETRWNWIDDIELENQIHAISLPWWECIYI